MQSNNLSSQEILPRRNTSRHREIDPSTIVNHPIHTPLPTPIQSIFEYLEPLLAARRRRRRVVDLRHVEDCRPFVGLCDRVVGVVGGLRAADYVAPLDANAVAGFDVDDLRGHGGLESRLAGEGSVGYRHDGVVRCCGTDAVCEAIVGAVDADWGVLVGW
jgi:hypothetical protein